MNATANLSVGDYLELYVLQTSGGTLQVGEGPERLFFGVNYLGA